MSESCGPRMKDVIRPGWIVPGSYRQEDLEAVVDLVPLSRAVDREMATECLRRLVDSFGAWRENTSHARPKQDDLKALDLLIQSDGNPEHLQALDAVLSDRLRLAAHPGSLRRGREDAAEILRAARELAEQIETEQRRGRRPKRAGWMFAHRTY